MELHIKLASETWEFEQIHRLNYRTFVEEIPQHPPNTEKRLVDRFHPENTYIIALHKQQLIGMIAVRGTRPFSLDAKLPSLDQYLPSGRAPVEIRLLAVEPHMRKTMVFLSLLDFAVKHCQQQGYDLAVISGTTRQQKLYRHLGFLPFGPLIGTSAAQYQPMYLTLETYQQVMDKSAALRKTLRELPETHNGLNFLPGPVQMTSEVRNAFSAPCISHRADTFLSMLKQASNKLCQITGARHAQILLGSGTLGNEVVAAQLSLLKTPGLIVSNGEFGERLIGHARRAQLKFNTLQYAWGTRMHLDEIKYALSQLPEDGWVWMVHHETSTGMLNPFAELKTLCTLHGLHLCLDCISSVGAIPVDLSAVYLATAVSGKGFGSYPGLSVVFHDYMPAPQPQTLPGYLDLGNWACQHSVPYTHSSNLMNAFLTALSQATPERMERIQNNMAWLRQELECCGLSALVSPQEACAAIVTLVSDQPGLTTAIGDELELHGCWLSYRSAYLRERHWLQISLLGNPSRAQLEKLMQLIRHACHRLQKTPAQNQQPANQAVNAMH